MFGTSTFFFPKSFCCREPKRATASIYALNAQFLGQKMLFRANEITL